MAGPSGHRAVTGAGGTKAPQQLTCFPQPHKALGKLIRSALGQQVDITRLVRESSLDERRKPRARYYSLVLLRDNKTHIFSARIYSLRQGSLVTTLGYHIKQIFLFPGQ